MTSVLAFILVIGILVFVHELGHFLAARRLGVRVLTFSLGFGPKLLTIRRGDTAYCISAIPLGGYVKMAGEQADETSRGAPDEFMSRSKWERFQILIMGPLMNILLAVVVMTLVLYQGVDRPAYEDRAPVVGNVATDSAADRAGIRTGDRIVSVAGRDTDTWTDFDVAVQLRAGRPLAVVVRAPGGRERTVQLTPDDAPQSRAANLGIEPVASPQIRTVAPGEPADRAGLQPNDVIEAVDGEPLASGALIARINASAGQALRLTVRRGEAQHEVTVTPALVGDIGLIGVSLSPFEVRVIEPGFFEAIGLSLAYNAEVSGLIVETLIGFITTETSPSQLVGPVGIAQLSGAAAESGWAALLGLMSMISLNLGILNLLPIPVLDGGHLFIMGLEAVLRRDFAPRTKERMMLAGFVLLLAVMIAVVYNDLTRISWFNNLLPAR